MSRPGSPKQRLYHILLRELPRSVVLNYCAGPVHQKFGEIPWHLLYLLAIPHLIGIMPEIGVHRVSVFAVDFYFFKPEQPSGTCFLNKVSDFLIGLEFLSDHIGGESHYSQVVILLSKLCKILKVFICQSSLAGTVENEESFSAPQTLELKCFPVNQLCGQFEERSGRRVSNLIFENQSSNHLLELQGYARHVNECGQN